MNFSKYLLGAALSLVLAGCGGGGGNASAPAAAASAPTSAASAPTDGALATAKVASIRINTSATTLNADGTSTVTLTVFGLTSGNAAVTGATIDLAATDGVILSSPTVTTTATGSTVTMVAVASDQTSRVSTVTASCVGCAATSATSQIAVVGAGITLGNGGISTLVVGSASGTLSATVRSVSGTPIAGETVTFASTDSTIIGLSATTAVTNSAGLATVKVSGLAAGTANINVSALGNAKSLAYTSGLPTAVLAVTSPANNAVMVTGVAQSIVVSAPGATSVTVTATQGTFSNGTSSQTVAVSAGVASATLTAIAAGTATVSINDNLLRNASLTLVVSPPVSAADKVLLNASQTSLPVATATNSTSLTLTARAVHVNGAADQSVANVPIEFSMTGGPGAGEALSSALVYTDSSGSAVITFSAGSAASIPNGIVISAKIQGTTVQTGTSPSSNSALLTIGGQALSVAFGAASVLGESSDKTLYIEAYSVQVTDANNNPVANKLVTLRLRPVAFSLGGGCSIAQVSPGVPHTYCSEDMNANNSLESSAEDGARTLTTVSTAGSCPASVALPTAGTKDSLLTPQNSDAGAIPSTVTTDANGIAAFNYTYLKANALWLVNKLTATVSASGTETSKSVIFRPAVLKADVDPDCHLPNSPYAY